MDFGLSLGSGPILSLILRLNNFYVQKALSLEFFNATEHSLTDPPSRRAIVRMAAEIIGKDPVDDLLPRLDIPVRIAWGKEDRILPFSYAERFMRRLPNAELREIPNCGHMVMMEYREEMAAYLMDFISPWVFPGP